MSGKEFEQESGLYAFGFRWYDPELSVWMSPDPMDEFFNPYSYVGGNPITFVDLLGLEADIVDPAGVYIFADGPPSPPPPSPSFGAGFAGGIPSALQVPRLQTPFMQFEVQTTPPPDVFSTPIPKSPTASELIELGVNEILEATDLQAQLSKAEEGGFRDKSGKIKKGDVLKASGILGASLLPGGKGKGRVPRVTRPIDPNKLHHIFGRTKHNLGPLIQKFGSPEAAFRAVESATESAVKTRGLKGVFETPVNVGGQNVVVRGNVMEGSVHIGTFFIP